MNRDWNRIMFDDIGKKIQKAAQIVAWSNIAISIVGGVVLFFFAFIDTDLWYLIFLAPIAAAFGCIMAWLSVITVYGFGKLIEDVEAIRNKKPPIIKVETEKSQPQKPANQNVAKREKPIKKTLSIEATQNIVQPTDEGKREKVTATLPCPACGEDLEFMGWGEEELKEKQTCPLCGADILF